MDLRNDPPATAANLLEQRVSDPDVAAAFDNRPPSAANLSERRVSEQEASLAEDGIKAAPSSAASTPYSSVAQPPAPPAASTLRGDGHLCPPGDRLTLSCRSRLEGQPIKALKKIVTDAGYDLTAPLEKSELLDIAVAVRLKHCPSAEGPAPSAMRAAAASAAAGL